MQVSLYPLAHENEKNATRVEIEQGNAGVTGLTPKTITISTENPIAAIVSAVQTHGKGRKFFIPAGTVPNEKVRELADKLLDSGYSPWNMKTEKKEIEKTIVVIDNQVMDSVTFEELTALNIARSVVRDLVIMPSNEFSPASASGIIEQYLSDRNIKNVTVDEVQDYSMGCLMAVGNGSYNEPRIVTLKYTGVPGGRNDISFVGKGITFDSGGVNIKPSNGLWKMKGDMAGAATAVGAVIYAAILNKPVNVTAYLALAENVVDSDSINPGDIVKAYNGKTVEIVDTDAEGRLVLADALAYAQDSDNLSKYTIDIATLTGAMVSALGNVYTGLFTEDEKLAKKLLKAGERSNDLAWRMPINGYEKALESKVADYQNLAVGMGAGASTAAMFLKQFAPPTGWAHLDIAGSYVDGSGNPCGRPLGLLAEFINQVSKKNKSKD